MGEALEHIANTYVFIELIKLLCPVAVALALLVLVYIIVKKDY